MNAFHYFRVKLFGGEPRESVRFRGGCSPGACWRVIGNDESG